jgi:hypothetical protein
MKLNIDGFRIGLERDESESNYFSTPKGAKVIGWSEVWLVSTFASYAALVR